MRVRPQEQGLDTVDANRALGLPDDCREYTSVRNILRDLGVRSVQLMVRGPAAAGVGGEWAGWVSWACAADEAATGGLNGNCNGRG